LLFTQNTFCSLFFCWTVIVGAGSVEWPSDERKQILSFHFFDTTKCATVKSFLLCKWLKSVLCRQKCTSFAVSVSVSFVSLWCPLHHQLPPNPKSLHSGFCLAMTMEWPEQKSKGSEAGSLVVCDWPNPTAHQVKPLITCQPAVPHVVCSVCWKPNVLHCNALCCAVLCCWTARVTEGVSDSNGNPSVTKPEVQTSQPIRIPKFCMTEDRMCVSKGRRWFFSAPFWGAQNSWLLINFIREFCGTTNWLDSSFCQKLTSWIRT